MSAGRKNDSVRRTHKSNNRNRSYKNTRGNDTPPGNKASLSLQNCTCIPFRVRKKHQGARCMMNTINNNDSKASSAYVSVFHDSSTPIATGHARKGNKPTNIIRSGRKKSKDEHEYHHSLHFRPECYTGTWYFANCDR